MVLREEQLTSREVFSGKVIRVKVDTVQLPNDNIATREVVCHNGGVSVLPIDNEGNVYLVRQFRYAFNEELLEIPAGKLEKDENIEEGGRRELEEEIGMRAQKFEFMLKFYPTVGYCNEIIYIYEATGLIHTKMNLDDDEFLNVEKYPFEEVVQMCLNNEIKDSKTIIAVLRYNEKMRAANNLAKK